MSKELTACWRNNKTRTERFCDYAARVKVLKAGLLKFLCCYAVPTGKHFRSEESWHLNMQGKSAQEFWNRCSYTDGMNYVYTEN
jgi:hypothetical protein